MHQVGEQILHRNETTHHSCRNTFPKATTKISVDRNTTQKQAKNGEQQEGRMEDRYNNESLSTHDAAPILAI
jgi:hypothetical protein